MSDEIKIADVDGLRGSGKELAALGTEIAGLGPQASQADDYAEAMPHSAVAGTASSVNAYFTGLLTAHSHWPLQLGGNTLSAVSTITHQDETSAAGLAS